MTEGIWPFDVAGYVVGAASIYYGAVAKQYKLRPKAISRWIWISLGVIAVAGNVAQNIIEFQDR